MTEKTLVNSFIDSAVPSHVAIIMDGNNRWAKQHGLKSLSGHRRGVERVRDVMHACRDAGVDTLTLFAFSSENWLRPKAEVLGLMKLFETYLKKEVGELKQENVRLRVVGSREKLSDKLKKLIADAEQQTAAGAFTLVLAVDYGGRWDITEAARQLAVQVQQQQLNPQDITEDLFGRQMSLSDLAPVDLMIRTSGEQRISNFLLWQCAYAEFYFTDTYWPDFDKASLNQALTAYGLRQRRYGKTAEQINAANS